MNKISIILFIIPFFSFSQNVKTLELDLPKNDSDAKQVGFIGEAIYLDKQKCFEYVMKHDVVIDNETAPNYFEISSLDKTVLFSGIIKKSEDGNFENIINFRPLEKFYKNSKIIGRNNLILNLSSNHVLNNNCSLNLENLRLFYEKSNENN
ncbi:hypothetical protein [Chryseobacterium luquanense]|uniref:Uncharacterized protein n=1 Tax=Chryseobacterium luquanense TaxID=2983766 RepID=A0ABT3Y1H6_9FLAO|nr:hypothetical protein [Chryseobacterium luquanense]MCX8531962.1 hypothetical protein [Chryseobacterium luquanense]